MPADSRRRSCRVWWRAKLRNSWIAISPVTTPDSRSPARNSRGRRTRSDEKRAGTASPLRRRDFLLRVARVRDLVADAPDGHDRRGIAELAAQLPDVDVHRSRVTCERVAPDALEQLVAGQHEPAVVEQLPEEVELLRRELDLLAGDEHLPPPDVDLEVPVPDLLRLHLSPLRDASPQDRLDAGDELTRVEGLRQIVVGADLEPDDLVDVLVTRGQHQDRDVGALADPPADLEPVHVRQHQVEHDQAGLLLGDLLERLLAGPDRADPVARVLQVERDEGRDRGLVLDDQNRLSLAGHALRMPETPVSPATAWSRADT